MMLELILAAAFAAGDFSVDVENARSHRGSISAVFKLSNHSAKSYQRVFVSCVFFDAKRKAVAIGPEIVSNVLPASKNYGEAKVVLNPGEKVESVSCSVTQATE